MRDDSGQGERGTWIWGNGRVVTEEEKEKLEEVRRSKEGYDGRSRYGREDAPTHILYITLWWR